MAGKTLLKDMTGQSFGRLTVVRREGTYPGTKQAQWLCRCECGGEKIVLGANLRFGRTKSCGCIPFKTPTRHGMSGTNIYAAWGAMRSRCENPKNPAFKWYGARGITVCERWKTFDNFYADMGDPPPGMSMDRIDNDGNYEPGNVQWASKRQQANNTRANVKIETTDGVLTLSQAAAKAGMTTNGLRLRRKAGLSGDQLVVKNRRVRRSSTT